MTIAITYRLEESVKYAEKQGEEDIELTKNQTKKLDFMTAKEKQYKSGLEKDEMLHFKLTGGDKSLTHDFVAGLEQKLCSLDKDVDEAKRNISGEMLILLLLCFFKIRVIFLYIILIINLQDT